MEETVKEKKVIDGFKVVEEFLLTKGESIVSEDMTISFKPLIDFGIIVYNLKANATNRLSMKFDLERFFMRNNRAIMHGTDVRFVKVPKTILDKVKAVNDQYRNNIPNED